MVQDAVLRIENILVSIIKDGISKKQIKPKTDPKKVAEVIIALVEGGFMSAKLLENRKYFDNSLDYIIEIINDITI